MRPLERLILDVIGRYVPAVDTDALRLDLLKQRATLSNVDLAPPGPVAPTLLFLGVPFAVSAPSILRSLHVSFSGGILRAEASGLHLLLKHVPYERAVGNAGINDALSRARRTLIAEAERHAAGLFAQLLNKFFPLLVDKLQVIVSKVEVVVEFPEGRRLELSMESLCANSVTYSSIESTSPEPQHFGGVASSSRSSRATAASNDSTGRVASSQDTAGHGDLAKDIVLRSLTIRFNNEEVFRLDEAVLRLRLRLGEFHVDLCVDDPVTLVLTDPLVRQLASLRKESRMWAFADQYRRPRRSPCVDPNAWWRYAVRVLMRSTGCGHIEADLGRSRLSRCFEYHRLHLERLNRGSRTALSTSERCKELEEVLDVETVMCLRARARRAVRTEKATLFAAEDWLGWMLIGDSGGSSGRQMATDVREAMSSLGKGHSSDESLESLLSDVLLTGNRETLDRPSAGTSAPWTHAVFSASCRSLTVSVLSNEDDIHVDFGVSAVSFRVEFDSPFSSVVSEARIGDVSVNDGRVEYVRRVGPWGISREGNANAEYLMGNSNLRTRPEGVRIVEPVEEAKLPDSSLEAVVSLYLNASAEKDVKEWVADVHFGRLEFHLDVARMSPIIALFANVGSSTRGLDIKVHGSHDLPLLVSPSKPTSWTELQSTERSDGEHGALERGSLQSGDGWQNNQNQLSEATGSKFAGVPNNGESVASWLKGMAVRFHGDELRLLVSSGLKVSDTEGLQRTAVLSELSRWDIVMRPFAVENSLDLSLSLIVSLSTCSIANDVVEDLRVREHSAERPSLTDDQGFILFFSIEKPLLHRVEARLNLIDGVLTFGVGDATISLSDDRLVSAVGLFCAVFEELAMEWHVFDSVTSVVSQSCKFDVTPYTLSAWKRAGCDLPSSESRNAFPDREMRSIRVTTGRIQLVGITDGASTETVCLVCIDRLDGFIEMRSSGPWSVSIDEFSVSDPQGDGEFRLKAMDGGSAHGLVVGAGFMRPLDGEAGELVWTKTVEVGSLDISVASGFLDRPLRFISRLGSLLGGQLGLFPPSVAAGTLDKVSETGTAQLTLAVGKLNVTWAIGGCSTSVTADELSVGWHGSSCTGELESLEILDLRRGHALHGPSLAPRDGSQGVSRLTKRVRFSISSSFVDLELACLHVVLFREFVEEHIKSVALFAASLSDVLAGSFMSLGPGTDESDDRLHARDPEPFHLNLTGSSLFVAFPSSLEDPFEVGVDMQEVVVKVRPTSLTISGRKVGVLTSNPALREDALRFFSHKDRDWCVLLAALDLDIQRLVSTSVDSIPVNTSDASGTGSVRQKEEWRVQLGHEATLLLSKRQILSVMAVLSRNIGHVAPGSAESECSSSRSEDGGTNVASRLGGSVLYRKVSYAVDAPGIVLELLPEDREGRVTDSVSSITVGSIGFVSEVFSEERPANVDEITAVTRMVLDVASLRVRDTRSGVPDPYRLVLNAEPNGRSGDGRDWSPVPFLHVQLHKRTDEMGHTTSKGEARILSPQVMWRPELAQSIYELFLGSSSPSEESVFGHSNLSTVSSSSSSSSSLESYQGRDLPGTAISKISVLVESPQIFVVESPVCESSRGVEIASDRVSISLLFDNRGVLVSNSQVRVRGIEVSLCSSDVLADGRVPEGPTDDASNKVAARHSMPSLSGSSQWNALVPSHSVRHSFAAPDAPSLSVLKRWAFDVEAPIVLVRIKYLKVRLPTVDTTGLRIFVPHAVLDGTVQDVVSFAVVASGLGLGFDEEEENDAFNIPPIHLILRDLESIVRVPQHRSREIRLRAGGDGSSLVRGRFGIDLRISEDLSLIELQLAGRGVRAYDGQSGVWDRRDLVGPSSVSVCISLRPRVALQIRCVETVRINLSPLIVKVLANLGYALQASLLFVKSASQSGAQTSDSSDTPVGSFSVQCHLSNFEVCIMSERLRVRTRVSGLELQAIVPGSNISSGHVAIRVSSFQVVNEAPLRRQREHGLDWSILVSPISTVDATGRDSSSSLRDRIEGLMLSLPVNLDKAGIEKRVTALVGSSVTSAVGLGEQTGRTLSSASGGQGVPMQDRSSRAVFAAVVQLGGEGHRDIEARFGLSGIDVRADADVIGELARWGVMLLSTLSAARDLYEHPSLSAQDSLSEKRRQENSRALVSHERSSEVQPSGRRLCKVAVEHIALRFSARAPSPGHQSNNLSLWRVFERLAGSEYASSVEFVVPKIFATLDLGRSDVVAQVGREYQTVLLSQHMGYQVLRQLPSLISLARVGVLGLIRHGEATSSTIVEQSSDRRRIEGLLEVTDESNAEWERRQCIRERVSLLESEALSVASVRAQGRNSALQASSGTSVTDVLDISGSAGHGAEGLDIASGILVYELLRSRDSRLRTEGGTYKFFVLVTTEIALLATDVHVLLVRMHDYAILEPRLLVSEVAGYSAPLRGRPRILVHFVDRRRDVLKQMRRDTGSMVEAMRTKPPFTLQCGSRAKAEWLASILPTTEHTRYDIPDIVVED